MTNPDYSGSGPSHQSGHREPHDSLWSGGKPLEVLSSEWSGVEVVGVGEESYSTPLGVRSLREGGGGGGLVGVSSQGIEVHRPR